MFTCSSFKLLFSKQKNRNTRCFNKQTQHTLIIQVKNISIHSNFCLVNRKTEIPEALTNKPSTLSYKQPMLMDGKASLIALVYFILAIIVIVAI